MTRKTDNSGVIITGSTVSGVVAGAGSTIQATISNVTAAEVAQHSDALQQALARIVENEAQLELLSTEVQAIRDSALKADESGFRKAASRLNVLLKGFGKSLASIGEAAGAVKAIGAALGWVLPTLA